MISLIREAGSASPLRLDSMIDKKFTANRDRPRVNCLAERDLTVAVGFIPRTAGHNACVAERRLKKLPGHRFNRRSATAAVVGSFPWLESHGYYHQVAPR